MTIEEQIFQRTTIVVSKLIPFGFQKINDEYVIKKNILNNNFVIKISIKNNQQVEGKIYDLAFKEEYTNFRILKQKGKFVQQIRDEFQKFLIEIRDSCTKPNYFLSSQANRITDLIYKKYHDYPEFLWTKYPFYGVFRNSNNGKWYAIIMNIEKNKITTGSFEVEILNVKLNPEEIKNLLTQKGFYEAYHMNKKNWLTIILDDTIPDTEILKYLEESYNYTKKK